MPRGKEGIVFTTRQLSTTIFVGCCLTITANIGAGVLAADQATVEPGNVVFEVASIRTNKTVSDVPRWRILPGGAYRATRVSLVDLILTAYEIEGFQLLGTPSWMKKERFDIVAKATGELTTSGARPTLPDALRALIKERFKLVEHKEVREFAVYALRVAREGRLGPNLVASDVNCAAIPILERKPGQCAVSAPGAWNGRYFAASVPIRSLVALLRLNVDRMVIDKTGLRGNFSIELNWTPDRLPPSLGELTQLSEGGSIFTAIQEQLGLKLEPSIVPMTVVVIDAIELPTND